MLSRKDFLTSALSLAGLGLLSSADRAFSFPASYADGELPVWSFPALALSIKNPIRIRSVELLKTQGELLLVVTSEEGVRGVTQCNDRMPHLVSLLKGLVVPHFVGKDARDVAQMADNAYRLNSNYKYAGMPLWNCIGSVEIAVWDLLGRIAQKPVYELLGKPVRSDYEVYVSDFDRESDPELIVERLLEKLELTGARGVKVKVGGRMVNSPKYETQTRKFIPLLRKKLGDDLTIYADANGSYSAQEGIAIGKLLEEHGVEIFEEPCNFEDEDALRIVNQGLTRLKLAGGEQDTSAYRFQRLAHTRVYDILQPDLYYNGGILRSLQVAEIARLNGLEGFAPHSPKADPLIGPFWQVAALAGNLYGLQELVYTPGEKAPSWHTEILVNKGRISIPSRPGLGIDYDGGIWTKAEKVV
jgi:L-alanine-DL-glutamate epimerase-like enolase superfamily enzyme